MIQRVSPGETARAREDDVLRTWEAEQTFVASVQRRSGCPSFVLYEGPPTANGEPHIGHVLGRVLKDLVGRYQTMCGFYVQRKAGWDTHGLPVELGVEKAENLAGKAAIEAYGVEKFIEQCRDSVFRYKASWHKLTKAIGYWVDLEHPYQTLDATYIESVWHLLALIHRQGLLQRGHRVSPYCPRCQTTLSSHEVAQGYKTVTDPGAVVAFPLKDQPDVAFLAWTTTPWTLPAHVALALHPEIDYLQIAYQGNQYILAKACVGMLCGEESYEILATHRGKELVGTSYLPPFPYKGQQRRPVYQVVAADFVSAEGGTGIVHMAPAHGEEDERAARQQKLPVLQLVEERGCYTSEVPAFAGRPVKECEEEILAHLRQQGRLAQCKPYEHSYPFCWRCDTALLYRASTSWFITTTAIAEKLQAYNDQVRWLPGHVKTGRFGNFLENVVDWNISRDRFWGTPLNAWICEACEHTVVPGSFAELAEYATKPLPTPWDPHKPGVDKVLLTCPQCHKNMRRTPEVIDAWFDSGSMPLAQHHVPFSTKRSEIPYPADFICEGIDQTRGWFYSLLAVAALTDQPPPYRTVLATGHVLDQKGQKMSKSKGNVIDPWEILDQYGADAFRWFLYAGSAPWQGKRFSTQSILEAKSQVDTLVNMHVFFSLYASLDHFDPTIASFETPPAAENLSWMDRWVLSRLQSTTRTVSKAMEEYDLPTVTQSLAELIDDISNWYIRRSRARFWSKGMPRDKEQAFTTLHRTLVTLSRLLAPLLPFVTESIHRNLMAGQSVHLTDYPVFDAKLYDASLEEEMAMTRVLTELGRQARNEAGIKTRQPLATLWVEGVKLSEEAKELLAAELNVQRIESGSLQAYRHVQLQLDLAKAGPLFGKVVPALRTCLTELAPAEAAQWSAEGKGSCTLPNGTTHHLERAHWRETITAAPGYQLASRTVQGLTVAIALDTTITPALRAEGWTRDIIRQIQNLRKEKGLALEATIALQLLTEDQELYQALLTHKELLHDGILLSELLLTQGKGSAREEKYEVDGRTYHAVIQLAPETDPS